MIEKNVLIDNMPNQQSDIECPVDEFLRELESVVEPYDYLGSVRYEEYREFDSVEHIFSIKNINGMSPLELVPTIKEIEAHMEEFSKVNGIFKFYLSSRIGFER